jgi:hypothetical protein
MAGEYRSAEGVIVGNLSGHTLPKVLESSAGEPK